MAGLMEDLTVALARQAQSRRNLASLCPAAFHQSPIPAPDVDLTASGNVFPALSPLRAARPPPVLARYVGSALVRDVAARAYAS